jgi:putative toxin-antitoxin system antitoxin component (TIGR02293 family)
MTRRKARGGPGPRAFGSAGAELTNVLAAGMISPPPVPVSPVVTSEPGPSYPVVSVDLGDIARFLALRPVDNLFDVHLLISKGLPVRSVEHVIEVLSALALDRAFEAAVGISARTIQRRRAAGAKSLSAEQSGRLWKFAEVFAQASEVLGSADKAAAWLSRPAMGLNRERPIDLLATPAGAELVQSFLTRLEYGAYT